MTNKVFKVNSCKLFMTRVFFSEESMDSGVMCANGGTEVLDILFEDGLLQEISGLQPETQSSQLEFSSEFDGPVPSLNLVSS